MATAPDSPTCDARTILRHMIATLAYRAAKVLRDTPPGFARFSIAQGTRTPEQILAHMGDLFDWGYTMAQGHTQWHDSAPLEWDEECARFFAAVTRLDEYLAGPASIDNETLDRLVQSPSRVEFD